MKRLLVSLGGIALMLVVAGSWMSAQQRGPTLNPPLSSAGPITFGPTGVLFMADNIAAKLYALQLGDHESGATQGTARVEGLTQKIGAMLGTSADEILINDIAVSPKSKNTFLSVSRGRSDAAPALLRVDGKGTVEVVALDTIAYTQVAIPNPAAVNPNPRTGGPVYAPAPNPRMDTVTDMEYVDGQIILSGLSNEEFASKLRAINYPFTPSGTGTSVEIWHASHGAFETRAPVYSFVRYNVNGQENLIAGYFCTPLVRFPLNSLASGNAFTGKVRGTTIAELGAYNRPLDMIVYKRNGEDFLLIATISKGVMKMSMKAVSGQQPITNKVPELEDIAGVPFEKIDRMQGTMQLAMLNDTQAVIAIKNATGTNLETVALP